MKLRSFTTMPELLWYYCSPDSESPTHLIFIVIAPLLPSCRGCFFVFGQGVPISGGFQHPPVSGCSDFRLLNVALSPSLIGNKNLELKPPSCAPLRSMPLKQRAPYAVCPLHSVPLMQRAPLRSVPLRQRAP